MAVGKASTALSRKISKLGATGGSYLKYDSVTLHNKVCVAEEQSTFSTLLYCQFAELRGFIFVYFNFMI